jgi:tetratricopeptide (TPR) repeat protein
MSRENILFALVGIGFGLFFGFLFVTWANQRPTVATAASTRAAAPADMSDAAPAGEQSSIEHGEQQQRTQGMTQEANKRARDNPQDYDAQAAAGKLNYDAHSYDDAISFYTRANQLRPNEVDPIIQLGNVNYDAGRYEAAEKWYTQALAKEPDNINVRTDLGLTFYLRNPPDYDRAIAEYRRSLERNPQHEPTLQNLIVALTKKGDKEEARAMLKKLQAINPNNPVLAQLQADLQ